MALTSLVVCADAKAVQVLSRLLREMGIRAEHSGDPHQAIDRLRSDPFDAVLVDCENETAAKQLMAETKLTSANKDILVIAIADGDNDTREIFSAGASFALYKPITQERAGNSLRAARTLMPNERRRKPRVPVYGPVSIAYGTSDNIPASLIDLGEEGVSIRTDRALAPSCKVYFEFKLPDHVSSVRLSGEVAWTDFTGRVGLQFSRVPQASRQLLDGWLRENLFKQLEAGTMPPELRSELAAPVFEAVGTGVDVAGNRRVQSRRSCRFGAEIYPLGSKVPQRCSLIDISPGGCYVETLSPLPAGTAIDIVVRTERLKVQLKGKVRSAHMGYGMGVEFLLSGPDAREQLSRLLAAQAEESSVTADRQ
jgi:CheY-like chemotaxis protein